MQTGLDVLLAQEETLRHLRAKRVGVLAHAASIDSRGVHIVFALRENGIECARIFAPEHGLWGVAQDMESVDSGYDAIVDSHVVSLYGSSLQSLRPDAESLADLDVIVIDIQDVGARYYTFVYTALFLAQAALAKGCEVYVVDRPNPIGASAIEGNFVDAEYRSFVGMRSMVTRHGMTTCELLSMWCEEDATPNRENLHCLWMQGYDRQAYFDETGLFWTPPSPNMPTIETAIVYPGMCLIEGTNLSEGRGTTRPFEYIGAPWVKPQATIDALACLALPGVVFRAVDFRPMFQKHVMAVCHGIQMFVSDRQAFRPLLTGIAILSVMSALHDEFDWRREVYEFEGDKLAIDLLFGTSEVRAAIESRESPFAIASQMQSQTDRWRDLREPWLHYR